MASKGKSKKGTKQAKGQSGGAWPTMMDTVGAMDKQAPSMGLQPARAPRPRTRPNPGITPKFRKLK